MESIDVKTITNVLIATVFIALGLSFLYKAYQAAIQGKLVYWHGFLPVSMISPLIVHTPHKEGTLIRMTQQWWVNVIFGPIFFLAALGCLATGADQLGLPGTMTINYVMTMGKPTTNPPIVFNSKTGYRFPFLRRLQDRLWQMLSKPAVEEDKPTDSNVNADQPKK